jgi:hypothetical protein
MCLTMSAKLIEANKVSLVGNASDITFAFAFQILLMGVRTSKI